MNSEKNLEINNLLSNLTEYPLFVSVFQIASVWIVSSVGYEIFGIILGKDLSYTTDPLLIASYYLFWIFVSVSAFWNIYVKWHIVKNEVATYAAVLLILGFIASYIIYILPGAPIWKLSVGINPASELLETSTWYFLPKSVEIILQQLLVYALVLSFYRSKYKIHTTAVWCALLFGSAHLLLVFGGPSLWYISLFTAAGAVAGFIFPYLILKTKNGFMYSYMLHWSFYAVLIFVLKNLLFV